MPPTITRNTDHDLLDIEEVARRMKVTDKTVRRYMQMGLESVHIGRALRFKWEWVEAFIEKLRAQQNPHVFPTLAMQSEETSTK